MSERDEVLAALETAVGFPDVSIIVRSAGAIAEVRGPLKPRRGSEWLTLGEESGSHVHLKAEDIRAFRFTEPGDGNLALEVHGDGGALLCKLSFRRTNPARPDGYDRERAESVKARFQHLREREAT